MYVSNIQIYLILINFELNRKYIVYLDWFRNNFLFAEYS